MDGAEINLKTTTDATGTLNSKGCQDKLDFFGWLPADALLCWGILMGAVWQFSQTPVLRRSGAAVVGVAASSLLLFFLGHYQRRSIRWVLDAATVALGSALACCIWAAVITLGTYSHLPRLVWLAMCSVLTLSRLGRDLLYRRQLAACVSPVVILGHPPDAMEFYEDLSRKFAVLQEGRSVLPMSGIFIDGNQDKVFDAPHEKVLCSTRTVESVAKARGARRAIIAVSGDNGKTTAELISKYNRLFETIYVAPRISPDLTCTVRLDAGSRLQVQSGQCKAASEGHVIKRVIDIVVASLLGLATLPFLLLIALSIALTSKGPVLYKQMRIGKGNRLFKALKFRTMFVDSADRLSHYLELNPALRVEWERVHKLKDDPRVTPIGRILRRFSLDELPQIWNVLVGDMSMVGPRPIVIAEIEKYGLDYAAYEAVRPGLTGLWQVSGRNDTTYQERVDYDAYYVKHWSPTLDLKIVIRTFRAVIFGTGAY